MAHRLVLLLAAAAVACTSAFAHSAKSPPAACPVTAPQARQGSGFGPEGFNYGNTRIRAQLNWANGVLIAGRYPDGGSLATISKDGSMDAKVGWWRGRRGKLVIQGWRLDGLAPPLRVWTPPAGSYGDTGFMPTGLTFPTNGCWRVTGSVGGASLTFVVEVTKPPEGVLVDCSSRSAANFPGAFTSLRNIVLGPLVLVGAAHASVVPEYGGQQLSQKFQLLVRNGHRITLELSRAARRGAGLAYGPLPQGQTRLRDTHRIVSFVACKRGSGSSADGQPVTFWAGGVLVRSPRCVPLDVWVDGGRARRRVPLRLGVDRC
jgi:hypothetical protein